MKNLSRTAFLPVCKQDLLDRGWYWYDFLLITGDAYVDHPSFGTAVISRVLEKAGYRVAILSQPRWDSPADLLAFGAPRLGVLVNAGNIDSMVAHYSVAKHRRKVDAYTPGGKAGKRPDRAVTVYSRLAKEAFPGLPVVIGGIEASLRRMAHYDYWSDSVMPSVLVDSGADLLIYGMGERQITEIAAGLKKKKPLTDLHGIRGTAYLSRDPAECQFPGAISLPSLQKCRADKKAYAQAALVLQQQCDHVRGKALTQPQGDGWYLIQNPPAAPLEGPELDSVFALPYARYYHPDYEAQGGVAAIEEVQFSIIHNRGCFGSCNFCALAIHQGRYVTARSRQSVLAEAQAITADPDFKGYIHDVGGPTANFRHPACAKQKEHGACIHRQCLFPTPCPNLDADQSDYRTLLRQLRELPGVKKVFVRSGIRFDYMMKDKDPGFFNDLVRHHVSGQLKVAPEHISSHVLGYMGKPHADVYDRFCDQFYQKTKECGKEQYLVPYLMSSHPGSRLEDAIALAQYLRRHKLSPQQVQDFYPTPGTLSTAMYYTGLDPRTMEPVYVARDPEEKAMQRALLQSFMPANRALVLKALEQAGRLDLIGSGPDCLIRGSAPRHREEEKPSRRGKTESKPAGRKTEAKPSRKADAPKPGRKPARPAKRK